MVNVGENPFQSEQLSRLRRRIAKNTSNSKSVAPHVLTSIEVNYNSVEIARNSIREDWKSQVPFSLTYLPFVAVATCRALSEYPRLNASLDNGEIRIYESVNLAFAVDLDYEGLVAPIVRAVEKMSVGEVALAIFDISQRARKNELVPDDVSGATFTLTNAGSYGTMLSFPIINQPNVAILSTDGVHRKPVVVSDANGEESICVASVGVLSLAWDHRPFDGAYVASFMQRLKTLIESTNWVDEIALPE
tara:strand:- start:417 stop:1160 length:744 start_codon:yes stop_codon:yes gene_type:complete